MHPTSPSVHQCLRDIHVVSTCSMIDAWQSDAIPRCDWLARSSIDRDRPLLLPSRARRTTSRAHFTSLAPVRDAGAETQSSQSARPAGLAALLLLRSSTGHRTLGMPSAGLGTAATQSCMTLGGCAEAGRHHPRYQPRSSHLRSGRNSSRSCPRRLQHATCRQSTHFAPAAVLIRTRAVRVRRVFRTMAQDFLVLERTLVALRRNGSIQHRFQLLGSHSTSEVLDGSASRRGLK